MMRPPTMVWGWVRPGSKAQSRRETKCNLDKSTFLYSELKVKHRKRNCLMTTYTTSLHTNLCCKLHAQFIYIQQSQMTARRPSKSEKKYIYIFMYNSSDSLCIHYNKKANDKFELNFMRIHQYVWFHITTNHVKYTRARHSNLRFMFYINPENKTLRIMIEMLPGS